MRTINTTTLLKATAVTLLTTLSSTPSLASDFSISLQGVEPQCLLENYDSDIITNTSNQCAVIIVERITKLIQAATQSHKVALHKDGSEILSRELSYLIPLYNKILLQSNINSEPLKDIKYFAE